MSDKFKQTTHIACLGGVRAKFTSDVYNDRLLDTAVEVTAGLLTNIDGEAINAFITDFNDLIKKYSI